jgi:hypothetical protein
MRQWKFSAPNQREEGRSFNDDVSRIRLRQIAPADTIAY